MTEPLLVSILIPSLGRPSLLETLSSIETARRPEAVAIEIVIADDSGTGAVAARLASFPTGLTIRIVPVGARNVSIARNATINAARGAWLLFIDDDEFVDGDWLVEHLAAASEHDADVVFGPVYPVYPETTPAWFRDANPMFHDMGWDQVGRRVDFGQSGNTLIKASTLARLDLHFDPLFGKTGGEDNDFFRRMAARGARLVVTNRAKAWEPVPPERATSDYMMQRSVRLGNIYARGALVGASTGRKLLFLVDATAKLAAAAAAGLLLWPVRPSIAFRMRMKMRANLGKLLALAGAAPSDAWKVPS